jgi:hypothetical protein
MSKVKGMVIRQGILSSPIGSSGPITITKNQVIRINKNISTFTTSIRAQQSKFKK